MSFSEEITLRGAMLDNDRLNRVFDDIVVAGGRFQILDLQAGQCRMIVTCPTAEALASAIQCVDRPEAPTTVDSAVTMEPAPADGVFPAAFYSTTNLRTDVWHDGDWHPVQSQEMDCGIHYREGQFTCLAVNNVRAGDPIVCGHGGIRVKSDERESPGSTFEFMTSAVSSERPKRAMIRDVAKHMRKARAAGKRVLLVGGPAIVHTGAGRHVVKLIEEDVINLIFAGNALATHDIEQALHGTSLGMDVERAVAVHAGHEHHIRSINTIRACGSIAKAVEQGVIKSGIMHACVQRKVPFVLAGSIRDDGPLPDVITDTLVAQDRMRAHVPEIGFVLIVATCLHGIATGNLLPAWIPMVCVDIEAAVATKLADRGSWQTVGIVTDVEPFFHELVQEVTH